VDTGKERTWLQCTNCGHIHIVERKIQIGRSIINSHCERCGHNRALNCGYSEDDLEELMDYFLDERYY
jgi:transcription elongation factor Elf1